MFRTALALIAFAAAGLAGAQPAAAPERVARLSYVEGEISFRGTDEVAEYTLPDRPLVAGDRLATAGDGRAELSLGSATLRLAEDSELTIADLRAPAVRFELERGTASLHLHDLRDRERFEIAVPNTTLAFTEPGEYRVDVPDGGATVLTVRTGGAEVMTAGGPVRVAGGQRVRIEGAQALTSLVTPRPADDFDDWVLEREVQFAESAPPIDEDAEYYGDETLDDYGDWQDDPTYGRVWMPSYAYGGYDPFGTSYWAYNGYGYSWVNPMPWSPYTYHYGHWAYLPQYNRWGWVAERRRRVERADRQLERELADDTPRVAPVDLRPPRSRSGDSERRVQATADQLGRQLESERRTARPSATRPSATSVRNSAATQRNAAAASAARSRTGSTMQPARTTSSGSREATRPSSSQATRPSSSQSTSKAFGKPQDP